MTYFWRLFLTLGLAVLLNCSNTIAYSLPIVNLDANNMQSGNYHTDRCQTHVQSQDYHQAIIDCNQVINLAPDNREAYLLRGLAHYRQGDDPAAIADYNRAITLDPVDFRAYYNRGLARTSEGKYSQAIADYNLALTQIPSTTSLLLAEIYNDRGLAYLLLQNYPAAILDFNRAIRLNDQDHRAYFNRGCAEGRNGNNLSAISNFSQVIKLEPGYAPAYLNRGIARYDLGYHQGAIADLKKASEYFQNQGKSIASKITSDLLHNLQQKIELLTEMAVLYR